MTPVVMMKEILPIEFQDQYDGYLLFSDTQNADIQQHVVVRAVNDIKREGVMCV